MLLQQNQLWEMLWLLKAGEKQRGPAAGCQGLPQSSVEGGAWVARGEVDQWDKHDAAHLILAPGRLWGEGARWQGALMSLAGSNRLEQSTAGSLLAHHVLTLAPHCTAGLRASAVRVLAGTTV